MRRKLDKNPLTSKNYFHQHQITGVRHRSTSNRNPKKKFRNSTRRYSSSKGFYKKKSQEKRPQTHIAKISKRTLSVKNLRENAKRKKFIRKSFKKGGSTTFRSSTTGGRFKNKIVKGYQTGLAFYTKLTKNQLKKIKSRNVQFKPKPEIFPKSSESSSEKNQKETSGKDKLTLYEKLRSRRKKNLRNLNITKFLQIEPIEEKKEKTRTPSPPKGEKSIQHLEEKNYLKKIISIQQRGRPTFLRREVLQTLEYCQEVVNYLEKISKMMSPKKIYKLLLENFESKYILMKLLFDSKGEKLAKQSPFMLEKCINWKKYHRYNFRRDLIDQRIHNVGIFQKGKSKKQSPVKKLYSEYRRQFSLNRQGKEFDFDFYSEEEIFNFYKFLDCLKDIYTENKIFMQRGTQRVLDKEIEKLKNKRKRLGVFFKKIIKDDRLAFFRYLKSKKRLKGVLGVKFLKEKFNFKKNEKWRDFLDPKILSLNNFIEIFSNRVELLE